MSDQNIKVIQSRLQHLSMMLDQQRSKNQRLSLLLNQQKSKVNGLQNQVQQTYNAKNNSALGLSLAKQQVTDLKLRQGVHQRSILKLQNQLEESKKQNNRLVEQMAKMETDYNRTILNLKQTLFEREKQLNNKQRQIHSLKNQNLELEKQTYKLKQKINQILLKTQRQMRRITQEVNGFRRQIQSIRNALITGIQQQKQSTIQGFNIVTQKIKILDASLKDKQQIKNQNLQLKRNIQDLVTENSRMVIEIYTLKQTQYD